MLLSRKLIVNRICSSYNYHSFSHFLLHMLYILLAEADSVREKPAQPVPRMTEGGRPRRKTVESKDVYKAPPNPYLEQEEPAPPSPLVSPTEEWLGDVSIIDCFDEAQSRKKLDSADLIGVSLYMLMTVLVLRTPNSFVKSSLIIDCILSIGSS